jgi:ribonuclease inhibitor
MPIKKVSLDGKNIASLNDFYDQLSTQLSLPGHFGCNLDALWDVLSADVEGPYEIAWKHAADSKKLMGRDFDRALKLLKDLKKERDDFKLKIEQ